MKARFFVAAALAAAFVVVPINIQPAAAAVLISPDAPRPVNVLPSVAKAGLATGIAAPASQQALMYYLAQSAKSPQFWAALNAVHAGTATPGQVATITNVQQTHRVPATAGNKLMRGVGGVATALVGLDIGLMIGAGVVDLVGIDRDAVVCSNTGGDLVGSFAQFLSKADCAPLALSPEVVAEVAVNMSAVGQPVCHTNSLGTVTWCFQLLGSRFIEFASRTDYITYCMRRTENGQLSNAQNQFQFFSTGGRYSAPLAPVWVNAQNTTPSGFAAYLAPAANSGMTADLTAWCQGLGGNYYLANNVSNFANEAARLLDYRSVPSAVNQTGTANINEVNLGDPDRWLECRIFTTGGPQFSAISNMYTHGSGTMAEPVCPDLPPEYDVDRLVITEQGTGVQPEVLLDEQVTPEYDAHRQNYPECLTGTCMLDLRKTVGTVTTSCFQTPEACYEWFQDPNRESTYSCHYGTHAVDLQECYIYAPSFTPNAGTTGTVYGSPDTGQPVPGSAGAPGPYPTYANSPAERGMECWPTGWAALNPVEWVYRPIQCALTWAFVPRTSFLQQNAQNLDAAWQASAPGRVGAAVSTLLPETVPGGCEGIPFDLQWVNDQASAGGFPDMAVPNNTYLLAACPGDVLHPWAIVTSLLLSGGIIILGARATFNLVGRSVNFSGVGG